MVRRKSALLGSLMFLALGIHAQSDRWVDSTLSSLTLEEKVGQLFVVELVALYTHQDDPAHRLALDMIRTYHVGGFILGGGTTTDIAVVTNELQRASKVPLLINGDLESGMSYTNPWRRSRGWTKRLPAFVAGGGTAFPSQMAIGATANPQYAYQLGRITAIEGRAIGIHWTNSPVADINNNPANTIINTRSYGEDPAQVARMVEAYVQGAQEAGMIATLKHFPGHGDTEEDTHMGLPTLPFTMERLDTVELVPFRAGIQAGARAVMTAHLALPHIDQTKKPATLSAPILTGVLRDHLKFQGIVMTDGMQMQGVTDHYSTGEAAVLAVEAGVDVVLAPPDIGDAFNGVLSAVRSRRISENRIDVSVRRILSAKSWVGLSRNRFVSIDSIATIVGAPTFQRIAEEISDASVTLLKNKGELIPLPPTTRLHVIAVTEEPSNQVGTELVQGLEADCARVTLTRVSNETGRERFAEVMQRLKSDDVVCVGIYLSVVAWKGKEQFSPPLKEFFSSLGGIPKPVILVAFGDPYIVGKLPETDVVMTPYNGALVGERSIARALAGRIAITGKLPVTIPGRYKRGSGLVLNRSHAPPR